MATLNDQPTKLQVRIDALILAVKLREWTFKIRRDQEPDAAIAPAVLADAEKFAAWVEQARVEQSSEPVA